MPAVSFVLRWPDGVEERYVSPSSVIHAHLTAGMSFTVGELVARTAAAMDAASERVRERYGFACTAAAEQQAAIERAARRYAPGDGPAIVAGVGAPPPVSSAKQAA
jgi:uncharacterized repeat protein (TIGR04042 family)